MSTIALRMDHLQCAGERAVKIANQKPSLLRRAKVVLLVPRALKYINDTLGGETLGRLSQDESDALYNSLMKLQPFMAEVRVALAKRRIVERVLFGWFMNRIEVEIDRLEDILESLHWSTDPELRSFINESIAATEQREVAGSRA